MATILRCMGRPGACSNLERVEGLPLAIDRRAVSKPLALDRRTVSLSLLLAVAMQLGVARAADAPAALDLQGTWHLLVHFRDEASENPEAHRWEDRVWKFEMKGRRLHWTEYPIVVFDDMSGRFEMIGGKTRARVLEYWEPNASQQRNIRDGLEINERGSRAKSLRGSPERGFRSTGNLRSASASVIAYVEIWSVDDPNGLPVFTRDDLLGSGRTESMQGRTRYTTTEVSSDATQLRGRFERDGSMHGSFRLTRAGAAQVVAGKNEHDPDEVLEIPLGFSVDRGERARELEALLASPDPASQRDRARSLVRRMLEQNLRERGQDDVYSHGPRVRRMTELILVELIDRGASLDEVEAMLRRRELVP